MAIQREDIIWDGPGAFGVCREAGTPLCCGLAGVVFRGMHEGEPF